MNSYKGVSVNGLDFFELLLNSKDFTSMLGQVTLAAGRLEAVLIQILLKDNIEKNKIEKATLGRLINYIEKRKLLERNMIIALKGLKNQRDYLIHNIYALFSDLKDETILEKNNLLDSDVELYIERASQLKKNLIDLADLLKKM